MSIPIKDSLQNDYGDDIPVEVLRETRWMLLPLRTSKTTNLAITTLHEAILPNVMIEDTATLLGGYCYGCTEIVSADILALLQSVNQLVGHLHKFMDRYQIPFDILPETHRK